MSAADRQETPSAAPSVDPASSSGGDSTTPTPSTPAPRMPELAKQEAPAMDAPTLLLSALLPLLVALYLLFGRRSGGGRGKRVLLFGPVRGGKTALYQHLKHGRVLPTVSSMEPSSATFAPRGGGGDMAPLHFCDMPGSGRLRERLKAEASASACLVCVLDGTQLAQQSREAAGMLFDVFEYEAVARRPPPLLIAVNKADMASCAQPAAAKKMLEQEVQRVRLARTTMQDTSGRSTQLRGIADDSAGAFSFDQLGCEVSFATTSVTKPDVDALLNFAQKHTR